MIDRRYGARKAPERPIRLQKPERRCRPPAGGCRPPGRVVRGLRARHRPAPRHATGTTDGTVFISTDSYSGMLFDIEFVRRPGYRTFGIVVRIGSHDARGTGPGRPRTRSDLLTARLEPRCLCDVTYEIGTYYGRGGAGTRRYTPTAGRDTGKMALRVSTHARLRRGPGPLASARASGPLRALPLAFCLSHSAARVVFELDPSSSARAENIRSRMDGSSWMDGSWF